LTGLNLEFGEWLCREVVKAVPHRHIVFSVPKILRRHFLYDRKLPAAQARSPDPLDRAGGFLTGLKEKKLPPAVLAKEVGRLCRLGSQLRITGKDFLDGASD
jgi:hypothetical protein